ncbi:MAG: MFS transporter [Gaiellales bacterium]
MGEWHLRSPKRIAFARIVLAGLGGFIALGAAYDVVPEIVKHDMHQTDVVVGWTLTIFAASALVCRFFAGYGMVRKGVRAIFALGFALLLVSGLMFLLVGEGTVGLLFAARVVQGFGQACMFTAGLAWAVTLAPDDRRGQAMSLFGLCVWAGLTIGPILAQLLIDHVGTTAAVLVLSIAPALALVAMIGIPAPERHGEQAGFSLPRPAMRPAIGLMFGAVVMATITGFAVLTFSERGHGGGAYVIAAYGAATFLGRIVVGHLPDRIGAVPSGAIAFVLAVLGTGVIAVAPSWPLGAVGGLVCGIAWSLLFPALGLLAVDRTPRSQRNSALAVYTAGFDLGTLVAGVSLGYIAHLSGYGAVYVFGTVFAIGGLGLVLSMRASTGPAATEPA